MITFFTGSHLRAARQTVRVAARACTRLLAFAAALTLLGLLGPAPATAQRSDADDQEWLEDCLDREQRNRRVQHCDVRVERMRAASALRIDASPNGGVKVVGQDRRDVEVHARIQAWAGSAADARAIVDDIEVVLESGEITSSGPRTNRDESWSVSFVVYVPRRSNLEIDSHNGPVSVEGVSGTIDAATQNGPLALIDVSGDVNARTQNGPLSVELTGSRWSGTGLDAETRNGPVRLRIPEGYSARLETGTVNGPMQTDIPLTITRMNRNDRRIETTLGSGGPLIRVVTTNGPVTISRN